MACVRETLDSLAQSSRSEEASPKMFFCLSYSSQQLVSISRTTSSRGEGQAEKTLCLVAVLFTWKAPLGATWPLWPHYPRHCQSLFPVARRKQGTTNILFCHCCFVLFRFFETESRITWVVSNAAELKLALIPKPPISLCEFWDYRHGPTYPGTNSLPPLCMLMCSGARLF